MFLGGTKSDDRVCKECISFITRWIIYIITFCHTRYSYRFFGPCDRGACGHCYCCLRPAYAVLSLPLSSSSSSSSSSACYHACAISLLLGVLGNWLTFFCKGSNRPIYMPSNSLIDINRVVVSIICFWNVGSNRTIHSLFNNIHSFSNYPMLNVKNTLLPGILWKWNRDDIDTYVYPSVCPADLLPPAVSGWRVL